MAVHGTRRSELRARAQKYLFTTKQMFRQVRKTESTMRASDIHYGSLSNNKSTHLDGNLSISKSIFNRTFRMNGYNIRVEIGAFILTGWML